MNIVTKLRFSNKITGIVLSLPQFIQTKMIKISNTEHLNDNNKIDLNNNEKTKTKNNENELIDLFETKLTIKDKYFESMDIVGAAKYLLSCKNCIFMTGAGISTSAGIPDFRSPRTGLYSNLSKYNLPYPEAVFCIDYFKKNPKPFYTLSKELMPKNYKPTIAHYFQRLLVEKGHVHKIYTQNIDALEVVAKIPDEKLINAHGSFKKGHCLSCNKEYSLEWMKKEIQSKDILRCNDETCLLSRRPHNFKLVKPDITFFGEDLPSDFYLNYKNDFEKCDLLIVMGTSLQVEPFGQLHSIVNENCPRILINRELVGDFLDTINDNSNIRDIFIKSDIDNGCKQFAKHLGMENELEELYKNEIEKLKE